MRFPRHSLEQLDIGQSHRLGKRMRSTDSSHSSRSYTENHRTPSLRSKSFSSHAYVFAFKFCQYLFIYFTEDLTFSATCSLLQKEEMWCQPERQRSLHFFLLIFLVVLFLAVLSSNSLLHLASNVPIISQHPSQCPPGAFPGLSMLGSTPIASTTGTGVETG